MHEGMDEMKWWDNLLGRLPADRQSSTEHEELEEARHDETMQEIRKLNKDVDRNAELLDAYKAETDAIIKAMEERSP